MQASRILVVKVCCMGDVIFLTPALRALRRSFPSAEISYLAASWVKDIVEQVPFVDRCILFDAPYQKRSWFWKIKETLKLIFLLRCNHFDIVVIGHRNRFFAVISWLAGIPTRVGFAEGSQWPLTHPVRFDSDKLEVSRYLNLVESIGTASSNMTTEICPLPDQCQIVAENLANWGISDGDVVVGIYPGGGVNPGTIMTIKRWAPTSYSELCTRILRIPAVKILLLGGADDRALNEEIRQRVTENAERIINVAGALPMRALPALCERCSAVIGGDTGPVHLAAAVGTATIFLFGPSDPRLVAPNRPNSVFLWKRVSCSPCYTPTTVRQRSYFRGKTFYCWTGTHECLDALTVEDVFTAFLGLIDSHLPRAAAQQKIS